MKKTLKVIANVALVGALGFTIYEYNELDKKNDQLKIKLEDSNNAIKLRDKDILTLDNKIIKLDEANAGLLKKLSDDGKTIDGLNSKVKLLEGELNKYKLELSKKPYEEERKS